MRHIKRNVSQRIIWETAGPLAAALRHWPGEEVGASLMLPLETHEGEVAGALWLTFDALPPADTSARIREFLEAVRPAIGNAVQVHAMRLLVIKDDTASCYNRRYFEEFLPEEMSRAARFRAPLSLIFFDLDNLKRPSPRAVEGQAFSPPWARLSVRRTN